jgi:hypothetical protein
MLLGAMLLGGAIAAPAAEPIKIGFSMELTGPFAVVGKTGLLAFKIWEDEVNAEGGLLGRPVKLVYYDDQSNPSLVPAIYTKLIDIDKVDLLISSYGTNLVVPAMPVAISHNRLFFGLFALAANDNFHYPKYFSMLPFGPEPVKTFAEGWFDLAAAQNPKPKTVAIVATDAEFQHKAAESARGHAKARGIDIVYDRAYPPTTVDFTPIVRAVQAAQPDLVYISSYPSDTVGILRSVGELGLDTKMLGGGLAGLRAAAIKMQLGRWPTASSMSICGSRSRRCNSPALWISPRNTRRRRRPKGSICSAISCRPSPTANCRSWATRSPRQRLSTTTSSPNTCTRTRSTRSRARSPSGPTANGPRRGRSGCSTTVSRGTMSSSSAGLRQLGSWRPPNTKPVTCSTHTQRRENNSVGGGTCQRR